MKASCWLLFLQVFCVVALVHGGAPPSSTTVKFDWLGKQVFNFVHSAPAIGIIHVQWPGMRTSVPLIG
jgi:hypothetical protein